MKGQGARGMRDDIRQAILVLAVAGLTLFGACQSARGAAPAATSARAGACAEGATAAAGVAVPLRARVECRGNTTVVTHAAAPLQPGADVPSLQPRPVPADFDGWVFIWINDQPLRTPRRTAQRWEPDAYVVASTGRTVMPIRFFTEAIGGRVTWQEAEGRVTLQYRGRTVVLWIGQPEALIEGERVPLDQPPFIVLDRTMIPTRFLMEAFGATVDWDPANSSVWVLLPDGACIDSTLCGEPRHLPGAGGHDAHGGGGEGDA